MSLIFSTFEAMHAHVQALKNGSCLRSFMANLRGIKLEVFVSMDKGLWYWATQDILDRLALEGSPGQRCVTSIFQARAWATDNGLSSGNWGEQKQAVLENLEWFIPMIDWLSLRGEQRDQETDAFNESIMARVDEFAPWFTANIRGLRHRFSFLGTGAVWCFANESLIERLGLSILPGRYAICSCGESRAWIDAYAVPGPEKQTALDYADHLKQLREMEFAEEALETMEIINAQEQKEVIEDTAPTRWNLQEN